jgi:hypothetical protein
MEGIFFLNFLGIVAFAILQVIIVRWVFRIDRIVMILEKTVAHLEDIKKQNNVLIKQQDEMLDLLDTDAES